MQVRRLLDDEVATVLAAGLELSRLDGGTLRSPTGFYVVAWSDGAPLGHAHLALSSPPELQDVLVLPAARGRGVGSALVSAVCDEARALGAAELRLMVSAANDGAAALYARLGFTDTGLPARHVTGPVRIRSGVIEVDDHLLTLTRPL